MVINVHAAMPHGPLLYCYCSFYVITPTWPNYVSRLMHMHEPWVYKELWVQEPIRCSGRLQRRTLTELSASSVWFQQPRFGDKEAGYTVSSVQVQFFIVLSQCCYTCQGMNKRLWKDKTQVPDFLHFLHVLIYIYMLYPCFIDSSFPAF